MRADVAIIQLVCALPLAVALANFVRHRMPAAASAGLALLLLGIGALPLTEPVRATLSSAIIADPILALLLRAASALGVAFVAVWAWAVLSRSWSQNNHTAVSRSGFALAGVGCLVLLLPPATYVGARCRHDVARLGEFLEQARFGEAKTLATNLVALDPGREWNGRRLPQVTADIDRIVSGLESRVVAPLATAATAGDRLERARRLAMLGRTAEAIEVLQPARAPSADPELDNLLGTIHETTGAWDSALESYRQARSGWESRPPGPERSDGLLRATKGIAFCQRKSGRYADAEQTYRQVLTLSPTADSHFLLAQFYEDAQDAAQARSHARRAIEFAPDRYRRDGEKLIRKLSVYHFGCLGVYFAENDRRDGAAERSPRGGS
jgi:tetratricopeptide (TPR) repeat protein